MERIKKTICTDEGRSHRNGVLPYIPYGSSSNTITNVDKSKEDGNFGQYVCDFTIRSGYTESPSNLDLDVPVFRSKEISRLRYLDIMRRYNYTQEQLRNGVYVKRYLVSERNISSIECASSATGTDRVTSTIQSSYKYMTDYEEINSLGMYDSVPLDIDYFVEENGMYSFLAPIGYEVYMAMDEDLRGDDEQALVDKVNSTLSAMSAYTYAVLIPNYDTVMEYDRMWEEWWTQGVGIYYKCELQSQGDTGFTYTITHVEEDEIPENADVRGYESLNRYSDGDSITSPVALEYVTVDPSEWRKSAFGYTYEYHKCSGNTCFFNFCREMDKFVLGRVEVVGSGFTGSKTPSFVFYTDYYGQMAWFKNFSAATMSAYTMTDAKSQALVHEWEEKGGGKFYDFLSGITAIYPVYNDSNAEEGIYFDYAAPRVEMETLMVNEIGHEWLYAPYEYSVVGYQMYGAVKDYVAPEEGIGSALTPHFVEFSSAETTYVDSKLDSLLSDDVVQVTEDIRGVFEEFDDEGNGRTYIVTYQTGNVVTTTAYESGYGYNYREIVDRSGNPYKYFAKYKIPVTSGASAVGNIPACAQYEWTFAISAISSSVTVAEGTETPTYDEQGRLSTMRKSWSESVTVTYGWWGANEYTGSAVLRCGDGEQIPSDRNGAVSAAKKYRNATILSCAPAIIGSYQPGDTYYIRARYKNGATGRTNILNEPTEIFPLKIPYAVGEKVNITSWPDSSVTYDMVISTAVTESSMTIDYGLGLLSGTTEDEMNELLLVTGIHYREEIPYRPCNRDYVGIDGTYMAELYYDYLDFSAVSETVYSDEYRLYRTTHRALLTGMEVGTQWTSSGAITAFLVTKENMDGLQEQPNYDLNLVYDRGSAAAWEYHFKLAECNTMADLEQYGNNAFNL